MKNVSEACIRRLPRYYRKLEALEADGVTHISSKGLGDAMGLTASQIRQDLNHFGGFGHQGVGYVVKELRQDIARVLGLGEHTAVIVGAGNVGRALNRYGGFERLGYRMLAFFESDPALVGTELEGTPVHDINDLPAFCEANVVDIVVLTVPAQAVETVVPLIASSDVKGVWNFAPVEFVIENIPVESIHLTDSLMTLTYRMHEAD